MTERESLVAQIAELQKKIDELDAKFDRDQLPAAASKLNVYLDKLNDLPTVEELLDFIRENPTIEVSIEGDRFGGKLSNTFKGTAEICVTIWENLPEGGQAGWSGRAQTFAEAAASASCRVLKTCLERGRVLEKHIERAKDKL